MAARTVTGLTPSSATSSLVEGSCAPSGRPIVRCRTACATRSELILLFMPIRSSTIVDGAEAVSRSDQRAGLFWGGVGVLAFSLSFPMTRLAVAEIDPVVVGLGRAVVVGVLAIAFIFLHKAPWPPRSSWISLILVSVGVVIGFPLLTSIALRSVPSAHGAVITGLLPIATAVMAVMRAGERPSLTFWISSSIGLGAVLLFAAAQGARAPVASDGLILLAVLAGGLGYAEGGALSRTMGGPLVICWALIISLPILVPVTAWRLAVVGWPNEASAVAWAGFAYVSLVSMFFGFFAWYRGLARGGVARVGQLQLAQPVLTLFWSALLLGEVVSPTTAIAACAVLASVGFTQVARKRTAATVSSDPRGNEQGDPRAPRHSRAAVSVRPTD